MTGTWAGVIGALFGVACAIGAVVFEHRRRVRLGVPSSVRDVAGVDQFVGAYGSDGVERFELVRAGAWAFAAVMVAAIVYGVVQAATSVPRPGAWAVIGVGAFAFGVASAVIGSRRS